MQTCTQEAHFRAKMGAQTGRQVHNQSWKETKQLFMDWSNSSCPSPDTILKSRPVLLPTGSPQPGRRKQPHRKSAARQHQLKLCVENRASPYWWYLAPNLWPACVNSANFFSLMPIWKNVLYSQFYICAYSTVYENAAVIDGAYWK